MLILDPLKCSGCRRCEVQCSFHHTGRSAKPCYLLIADGTGSLAHRFGKGTEEYAFQVKGLDMICGDPRGLKAFGLTYAIASRGADHLRAEPFFELTERQALLTDCLTMCKNAGLSMDILDFDFASRLLRAGTGLDFTPERVERPCGSRQRDGKRVLSSEGVG
jgi:aldehyde:ferredoxin oxidoreductase